MGTLYHYRRKTKATFADKFTSGIIYLLLSLVFVALNIKMIISAFNGESIFFVIFVCLFCVYASYCFAAVSYMCFSEAHDLKKKQRLSDKE